MTLPTPADSSQQALLDAVWEEFTLRGQWPSFGQVDRRLDRYRGLAGDELIRRSSNELVQSGGPQQYPQDDQQLRLTIAGVAACTTGEAALYVRLFLDVVRLATEAEAGTPLDVTEPAALRSEDVRTRLTLPPDGVGRATIARIEGGAVTPQLRTIRSLAETLHVDPRELTSGLEQLWAPDADPRQAVLGRP